SHLLDEVEKVCSHVVVLRKGEVLYSGSVDGMSANEGFFEVSSDDNLALKSALHNHQAIAEVKDEDGKVLVYLKADLSAQELNQFLFSKNIILSHLVKRKNSLEAQFLELTKNTNPKI
ncbi:MAG: ABC transporter ATP-binding protein, partial [Flavobacterium sp.]